MAEDMRRQHQPESSALTSQQLAAVLGERVVHQLGADPGSGGLPNLCLALQRCVAVLASRRAS
eukprot:3955373-Prymnesium_polylepis.2